MHGAFWMQSARGPEIDVAEYFGNKSKDGIASFLHSRPNSKGRITSVGGRRATANKMLNRNGRTPASGYHVYTVDWTPAGYVFRVDGVETMRTTKLRSKDPHFLVLSLLASDWEIPKIKRSQLSKAYMDVDWVRVWQSK
jgi:beta-glucanase (GH16 family)